MRSTSRQSPLLLGFLIFSLLLHVLVMYLVPERSFSPPQPAREPVVVEVRPPQPPPPTQEREIDTPPRPDQTRETPARRLGPSDSIAEREMAPQGDAHDDFVAAPPAPVAPAPPAPPTPPAEIAREPEPRRPPPAAAPREPQVRPEPRTEAPQREERAEAPVRPAPEPAPAPLPAPPAPTFPDLKTLTTLPDATVARLESEWRQKYRAEVERGEAYFLDMERDILISFFQRFRNNVYNVWNYPIRSRESGEEGTSLLRITVNRDGTLAEVRLMESTGHPRLDEEALAAVRKGAPYGRLPRAYEGETLTIFAFFNYSLTRMRGPGDIY
jgi:periplasmic protein TonB